MSGGHFDYIQFQLNDVVEEINRIIMANNSNDGDSLNLSKKTIEEFQKAIKLLKVAEIYIQRIDWFLSGDDGGSVFNRPDWLLREKETV